MEDDGQRDRPGGREMEKTRKCECVDPSRVRRQTHTMKQLPDHTHTTHTPTHTHTKQTRPPHHSQLLISDAVLVERACKANHVCCAKTQQLI